MINKGKIILTNKQLQTELENAKHIIDSLREDLKYKDTRLAKLNDRVDHLEEIKLIHNQYVSILTMGPPLSSSFVAGRF